MALMSLSIFSTALAFTIYFRLVHTLGSLGTTAQAYVRVPVGVAIGVIFLGEELHASTIVGLLCILTGVVAMTLPPGVLRLGRSKSPARQDDPASS